MAKQAERKTQPGALRVTDFVNRIEGAQLKRDTRALLKLFRETTGYRARMWGPSIIGFGRYRYTLANGGENTFMATGFSPRKSGPTIYLMPGFKAYGALLAELGPHRLGKSCLYLKRLDEVDQAVLQRLIERGLQDMEDRYAVGP